MKKKKSVVLNRIGLEENFSKRITQGSHLSPKVSRFSACNIGVRILLTLFLALKQDRQCTYNVTLGPFLANIVAVEKQ